MTVPRRSPHQPIRLCLGCNLSAPRDNMARFTLDGDRATLDPHRRRPGRGGYLHMEKSCAEAFLKRKPFLRSLRAAVPVAERARLVAELLNG